MSIPYVALLLCLWLAAPSRVAAQAAEALGVHEAVGLALAQSPRMNELRARRRMTASEWWGGFGLHSPELVYAREGITGGGFTEQRWGLSQTIDAPLQSYYRLRRTDAEADALGLLLDAEALRVRADVKRAYTDVLYTQEIVHLRGQEVALNEQLLEAVALRASVGEASELERMKAEIALAEAESNLGEARRQFQDARYALFHAVGIDPEAQHYTITFPDTLAYIATEVAQADVMAALVRQPALRGARRQVDAAGLGVRQARASLLPALSVDYFPQDFSGGYRAHGFQVGLELPLWIVPNYRSRVRRAQAERQARSWQQQAVALDLKKAAEQAWHGYETSRAAIRRYQATVQTRAEALMALTLEGYRLGEIDLLTLLDNQRTYLSTQLRYYDALRDHYHRLIELERFLGREVAFAAPPPGAAGR